MGLGKEKCPPLKTVEFESQGICTLAWVTDKDGCLDVYEHGGGGP